jgi:hypothetical protein
MKNGNGALRARLLKDSFSALHFDFFIFHFYLLLVFSPRLLKPQPQADPGSKTSKLYGYFLDCVGSK